MDSETKPTLIQFNEHRIYESVYEIFESEFVEIGRYIAFTEANLPAYSNKVHELHLRICSEIENILKAIVHKHFVTKELVQTQWDNKKSSSLKKVDKVSEYEALKKALNAGGRKDMDRVLFGFPDFQFYFDLACKHFNLHKKVVVFLAGVTTSSLLNILQPFELQDGDVVPRWWSSYNKIKHDKLVNFASCTLGDLLNAIAGFFILMNYLTKYWQNNLSTFQWDYFVKYPQGNYIGCEHWAFASRLFRVSSSWQSVGFSSRLPRILSDQDYEAMRHQVGRDFDEVVDTVTVVEGADQNVVKSLKKEHCIFHTYFDYMSYASIDGSGTFRQKERYGRFVN